MTTSSKSSEAEEGPRAHEEPARERVVLELPADLARALRRCTWMIIHETGRDQRDIMQEMVLDFLVKHGC